MNKVRKWRMKYGSGHIPALVLQNIFAEAEIARFIPGRRFLDQAGQRLDQEGRQTDSQNNGWQNFFSLPASTGLGGRREGICFIGCGHDCDRTFQERRSAFSWTAAN